jgi:uncharacterized membrane protein YdjX (TVP38/TMEM64 family)
VVLGIVGLWLAEPQWFTAAHLETILQRWGPWAFAGFVAISAIRGALLIPSTPVVLAGGALFPDATLAVLAVSMAGIICSATLLYRFPGFAGYDKKLAARYPDQLELLQGHLKKPRAVWIVALWSFFPAVPTDLICYAAGLVRMPFGRMVAGLVLGELPLVTGYILLGENVAAWLLL